MTCGISHLIFNLHSPCISHFSNYPPIMSNNPQKTTLIMEDQPLKTVGVWRLIEAIGQGGMATVYRGEAADGRIAAIKVFAKQAGGDVAAIVNEAMAMRAVCDPHVIMASSCGEDAGSLYLVMELLPGGDTKSLISDNQRLVEADVLKFAEQCARGLKAIHVAGFLHRDLKPSNVMIDGSGNAKIVDLGLVFPLTKPASGSRHSADSRHASSHAILGTPAYMSPEQARGEKLDATTDLWSLGATMWHWAVGVAPFRGESVMGVITHVAHGEVPDPCAIAPVPQHLRDLIMFLMERRREHRYADADEVLAAIRAVREGNPPPPPKNAPELPLVPRPMPRSHRLSFVAGSAVAALAVIGSAFALGGPSRDAVRANPAAGQAAVPEWAMTHVVRWIGDDRLRMSELGPMRYERSGARALFAGGALECQDASALNLALARAEAFTIELELTPGDLSQQGPARIISLSLNHRLTNLMIGQSGSRLEARCRTTTTSSDGTRPSLVTPEGTLTGKTQHVAFVRRAERNELWIDGVNVATAEVPGSLNVWDPAFPLIIGDEHRGGYPWTGAIDRLAVYARAMDANEIAERARLAREPLDGQ